MLICLDWHFCYTNHFKKSWSWEGPSLVCEMFEGTRSPCRREVSAGHGPGELLLAQGWEPLENHRVPCWGQGVKVTLMAREMPTPRWWESMEGFRNVCLHEPVSVHTAFAPDFLKRKKCRLCGKSPFLHNFLAKTSPAFPWSLSRTGRGSGSEKWQRRGEVKRSLRSAVIKISPFFFLPNRWGSLCGWTQTRFLGRRMYLWEECGSW